MSEVVLQLLPVLAGAAYAASAIYSKRATVEGGGLWRVTFLTNWGLALALMPLLGLAEGPLRVVDWWNAGVTSIVFFAGQLMVFGALRYGEVSVVTPVMGVKVLVVAAMAVGIAQERLPERWWWAAVIAAAAAALLGAGRMEDRRRVWIGIAGGLGGAVAYSGVDICFQLWAGAAGLWRFTAMVLLLMAVWSLALLPRLEGPFWRMPRAVWHSYVHSLWLSLVQVVVMAYCVVALKGAAWANLLYSSRGVWSVVMVWGFGSFFGNSEGAMGGGVMLRRLMGSALLLGAIALVLV